MRYLISPPIRATKAGFVSFGEALRRELAGKRVSVLTIYPTATETPMMTISSLAQEQRQVCGMSL
ncbi:SDR family NAD(P)-dependent oxidoreductase [Sphingomonas suaedae]|uniref:SDR family NAD(P)-dependent oxidoreductase n=1 Tax=Sphingomonas suaedae TaxID=2599297 RepID=A0A518RHI5_9SPHN|nr:SDR family NAD(P)-dependent oxidoreductase [Sphingomonas suaedae]